MFTPTFLKEWSNYKVVKIILCNRYLNLKLECLAHNHIYNLKVPSFQQAQITSFQTAQIPAQCLPPSTQPSKPPPPSQSPNNCKPLPPNINKYKNPLPSTAVDKSQLCPVKYVLNRYPELCKEAKVNRLLFVWQKKPFWFYCAGKVHTKRWQRASCTVSRRACPAESCSV